MAEHLTSQRDFAFRVVERLRDAGHEALWAGGCVRDQLLGLIPKDYDVATSATPDQVRELFGRRRTLAIGAAFGVISVRGGKFSPIEVATFRTDGKYRDGRHPESVTFSTAEEDAQRRDFTVNGLFFDPLQEKVVDYVGGVADLQARLLRAIGEPRHRFTEDKLRMLRAVRFAATYDFALDPSTLEAIREMAGEVTQVSGERIGAELRRIITHSSRAAGVQLLHASHLLKHVLPEVNQHADAGDALWQDCLARLQRLAEPTVAAALAALLFDMLDEPQLQSVARRIRLSNKELDRTRWLLHALPVVLHAASLPWPRLQRVLAHEGGTELLQVAQTMLMPDDPNLSRCRTQLARPLSQWNPPPLATGDHLIAQGIRPGRHFAALLEYLRDEQLEGRLLSREQAIDAARAWVAANALPGPR